MIPGFMGAGGRADAPFSIKTWTGTGASHAITGVGFDCSDGCLVLIKRYTGAATSWCMASTTALMGAGKHIATDVDSSLDTDAQAVTSFDGNGITVGTSSLTNASGAAYVGYFFRLDTSTTFSCDNGTANIAYDSKGKWAIVDFDRATGDSSATITLTIPSAARGTGAPYAAVFDVDANNPVPCKHPDSASGYFFYLNGSEAETNSSAAAKFGNNSSTVDPTNSAIVLGNDAWVGSNTDQLVLLLFYTSDYCDLFTGEHTTGTDTSVSVTVNAGTPKAAFYKNIDLNESWNIIDGERGTSESSTSLIRIDTNASEITGDYGLLESGGIEIGSGLGAGSARTYVGMAFG